MTISSVNSISPSIYTPSSPSYPQEKDWIEFEKNLPSTYSKERKNYTPLQVAVINGNIDACKTLLEGKADPNDAGGVNITPLRMALIRMGNEEISILLMEKGATITNSDLRIDGKDFPCPIWFHALLAGKECYQFIVHGLQSKRIDPNAHFCGGNVLVWAATLPMFVQNSKNWQDILHLFIQEGAAFYPCISDALLLTSYAVKDSICAVEQIREKLTTMNLLQFSILQKNKEFFSLFVKEAKEGDKFHRDKEGLSILHYAASKEDAHYIQCFLEDMEKTPWLVRQLCKTAHETPLSRAKRLDAMPNWPKETIKAFREADAGYTKWMKKQRRFINITEVPFSIQGDFTQALNKEGQWEPKNPYLSLVKNSFFEYMGTPNYTYKKGKKVLKALTQANERSLESSLKRYAKAQKVVIVPTGWKPVSIDIPGHAVTALYWKKARAFVKVNLLPKEEDDLAFESGISFFRIDDSIPEETITASITKLYRSHNQPPQEAAEYYLYQINEELKLQRIKRFKAFQKVENCPYASAKYTLLALLFLFQVQNPNIIDEDKIQTAWQEINGDFARWEEQDFCRAASLLWEITCSPHAFTAPLWELYAHFIKECLSKQYFFPIFRLLLKDPALINWKEPETGRSLIRLFYAQEMWSDVQYLLEKYSPDLHVAGIDGKTLADDAVTTPPPEELANLIKSKCQVHNQD